MQPNGCKFSPQQRRRVFGYTNAVLDHPTPLAFYYSLHLPVNCIVIPLLGLIPNT